MPTDDGFRIVIERRYDFDPLSRWYWTVSHGLFYRSGITLTEAGAERAANREALRWYREEQGPNHRREYLWKGGEQA